MNYVAKGRKNRFPVPKFNPMNISMIKTEIQQILETMGEQWETLRQHEGRIPQIEIDLILANIRDLYESFLDLQKKNNETPAVSPPASPAISTPARPVSVPPLIHETPVPHEEAAPDPLPFQKPTPPSPVAPEPLPAAANPVQPAPAQAPEPDLFSFSSGPVSISDKLKEEKKTINERLQQEHPAGTIGSKLNQNPIRDLKSAIGINEKFQFINELFNGSMQDYAESINQLNLMSQYDEAMQLIDIYKFKYNWDTNSDAFHKIMDFLRRRFL